MPAARQPIGMGKAAADGALLRTDSARRGRCSSNSGCGDPPAADILDVTQHTRAPRRTLCCRLQFCRARAIRAYQPQCSAPPPVRREPASGLCHRRSGRSGSETSSLDAFSERGWGLVLDTVRVSSPCFAKKTTKSDANGSRAEGAGADGGTYVWRWSSNRWLVSQHRRGPYVSLPHLMHRHYALANAPLCGPPITPDSGPFRGYRAGSPSPGCFEATGTRGGFMLRPFAMRPARSAALHRSICARFARRRAGHSHLDTPAARIANLAG